MISSRSSLSSMTKKDVLTYSYYGKNGGKEYAQYNNGIESYTYDNGEYSHLVKGDKDFFKVHKKRQSTHKLTRVC